MFTKENHSGTRTENVLSMSQSVYTRGGPIKVHSSSGIIGSHTCPSEASAALACLKVDWISASSSGLFT